MNAFFTAAVQYRKHVIMPVVENLISLSLSEPLEPYPPVLLMTVIKCLFIAVPLAVLQGLDVFWLLTGSLVASIYWLSCSVEFPYPWRIQHILRSKALSAS
jgi:hypothetical protein